MPGLKMLDEHATWPGGGYDPVAATVELNDRINTGRFYVSAECVEFFEEYRQYPWKDGKLNQVDDDVLSALFKTLMMKRSARPGPLGANSRTHRPEYLDRDTAAGTHFDLSSGQPFDSY